MKWRQIYNIPTDMGLVPEDWPAHITHPADDVCYYAYMYYNLKSCFDVCMMIKAPEDLALLADLGDMFMNINQTTNSSET